MDQSDAGPTSVITIFVIGLMFGAQGGLLLGGTQVVVLQSLELLDDDRLLMDHLEKPIRDSGLNETNNNLHDISILAEMFGVLSSALSLLVGVSIGSSAYSLVIKKNGEAAKALALAGTVCLTIVTVTGYILGLGLKTLLSIRFFLLIAFPLSFCIAENAFLYMSFSDSLFFKILFAIATFAAYILNILFKVRLVLTLALIPTILVIKEHSLKLAIVPLLFMLILSDCYKMTGQHIITINTSSDVAEAIFVGVLASQMWTMAAGMILFVCWQRGGAGKICAAAAGSGGAVLTVIKAALPVLGPGPSIGALMGVAGAVGVSVSAAVAATDQYGQGVGHCGFVGTLGVTVGAGVGAFLSSCTHSGLSGLFVGLSAATIPVGAFLIMFFHSKS